MQDDSVQPQNLNQNPSADDSIATPQNPPDDQISSFRKEAGPISSESPLNTEALIKPSEAEPNIAPEVENAGVQAISNEPKLTPDAHSAGVTYSKESIPAPTGPSGKVTLPMSAIEAEKDAKGDPSNSLTWLAKMVLVYLRKIGGAKNV